MERLNVLSPIRKIYENGTEVEIVRTDASPRIEPGKVAKHEAAHVIAAGEIVFATIIQNGDALGTTQPVKMTAAAAAAAEALGYEGTGMDMFIVEHVLGVDPSTAKSAARSELSGQDEELEEVATLLQERKTIGQDDVEQARENVRKRRKGIHPVVITIVRPNGQRKAYTTESEQEKVWIDEEEISSESTADAENYPLAA